MGLSSKKTKTTTNQNTTATTTPTNPTFVTTGIEGLSDQIKNTFAGIDPKTLVGGPNPLMNLAGANAGGLTAPTAYTGAENLFNGVGGGSIGGESVLSNIQQYFNPVEHAYKDAALGDFDYGAGQIRAQDLLDLGQDATFGGSGGAIKRSITDDNLTRGRGSLSAQLSKDAFDKAAALSAGDADRRQAAAQATASNRLGAASGLTALGGAQGDDARANIATQLGAGNSIRDATNQANQSPIQALMQQIAAFGGLPLDLLKGATSTGTMNGTETSKSSGMGLSDWVKLAQAAATAAAASDVNLKTDIKTIGHDRKGRRWVSWRWKWDAADAARQTGVIAQEVRETDPDAVFMHPAGFLMVDYGMLGDD